MASVGMTNIPHFMMTNGTPALIIMKCGMTNIPHFMMISAGVPFVSYTNTHTHTHTQPESYKCLIRTLLVFFKMRKLE
jgi:hypothetical protein